MAQPLQRRRRSRWIVAAVFAAAVLVLATGRLTLATRLGTPAAHATAAVASTRAAPEPRLPVRLVRFAYRTHGGRRSFALVLLPGWYRPGDDPPLPLVICPHGRNTSPYSTAKRWRDLPTRGTFAVVLPAGQGRRMQLDSWGYPGQIDDLARMPRLVERKLPYFHLERRRVYAVGESMGAQEVLLLLAKDPHLLAGVISFDPAVDMAERFYAFPSLPFGRTTQRDARIEVGGTPRQVPGAYARRSPIMYAHQIAASGVPLELWWSRDDRVIVGQQHQAGRLYRDILRDNPNAPVLRFVGGWHHAAEGRAVTRLPAALARIGLLPASWLVDDPLRPHHGTRPRALAGRRA